MSTTTTYPSTAPPPIQPKKRTGLKIVIGFLMIAVLAVGGAIAWLLWTDAQIERIPEEELTSLVTEVGEARTILVVGSDSRENLPDELDQGNFGNFAGRRTDVIMLVNFVPGEGAQMLSIPRDLKVEIPENGTNRINAAYAFGGPDLLVRTLRNNLGIEINNYVEIDFAGFAAIVDSLDGVTVEFPYPARDVKSGLNVDAGVHTLTGAEALAYARSRSYQELQNGSWVGVDANDIGRTQRQQELLLTMFDQVSSRSGAFNLPGFASTVAANITTDAGMDLNTIIGLGQSALDFSSADLDARTLPVVVSSEGGRSYVIRVEPEAQTTLDAFTAGEPFPSL